MTNIVSDAVSNDAAQQSPATTTLDYLQPDLVVVDLIVKSRKRLFEEFAELIVCSRRVYNSNTDDSNIESDDSLELENIFDTLHDRERLGSTAIGKGIALPHGRIDGLTDPVISIARLETPIDYDALDGVPVWLAVCLLVPSDANEIHLNLLAKLASKFSDEEFVCGVKETTSSMELYNLFTET